MSGSTSQGPAGPGFRAFETLENITAENYQILMPSASVRPRRGAGFKFVNRRWPRRNRRSESVGAGGRAVLRGRKSGCHHDSGDDVIREGSKSRGSHHASMGLGMPIQPISSRRTSAMPMSTVACSGRADRAGRKERALDHRFPSLLSRIEEKNRKIFSYVLSLSFVEVACVAPLSGPTVRFESPGRRPTSLAQSRFRRRVSRPKLRTNASLIREGENRLPHAARKREA